MKWSINPILMLILCLAPSASGDVPALAMPEGIDGCTTRGTVGLLGILRGVCALISGFLIIGGTPIRLARVVGLGDIEITSLFCRAMPRLLTDSAPTSSSS